MEWLILFNCHFFYLFFATRSVVSWIISNEHFAAALSCFKVRTEQNCIVNFLTYTALRNELKLVPHSSVVGEREVAVLTPHWSLLNPKGKLVSCMNNVCIKVFTIIPEKDDFNFYYAFSTLFLFVFNMMLSGRLLILKYISPTPTSCQLSLFISLKIQAIYWVINATNIKRRRD